MVETILKQLAGLDTGQQGPTTDVLGNMLEQTKYVPPKQKSTQTPTQTANKAVKSLGAQSDIGKPVSAPVAKAKAKNLATWKREKAKIDASKLSAEDKSLAWSYIFTSLVDSHGNEVDPTTPERALGEYTPTVTYGDAVKMLKNPALREKVKNTVSLWHDTRTRAGSHGQSIYSPIVGQPTAEDKAFAQAHPEDPNSVGASGEMSVADKRATRGLELADSFKHGILPAFNKYGTVQQIRDQFVDVAGEGVARLLGTMLTHQPEIYLNPTSTVEKMPPLFTWSGALGGNLLGMPLGTASALEYAGNRDNPINDRRGAMLQVVADLFGYLNGVGKVVGTGLDIAANTNKGSVDLMKAMAAAFKNSDGVKHLAKVMGWKTSETKAIIKEVEDLAANMPDRDVIAQMKASEAQAPVEQPTATQSAPEDLPGPFNNLSTDQVDMPHTMESMNIVENVDRMGRRTAGLETPDEEAARIFAQQQWRQAERGGPVPVRAPRDIPEVSREQFTQGLIDQEVPADYSQGAIPIARQEPSGNLEDILKGDPGRNNPEQTRADMIMVERSARKSVNGDISPEEDAAIAAMVDEMMVKAGFTEKEVQDAALQAKQIESPATQDVLPGEPGTSPEGGSGGQSQGDQLQEPAGKSQEGQGVETGNQNQEAVSNPEEEAVKRSAATAAALEAKRAEIAARMKDGTYVPKSMGAAGAFDGPVRFLTDAADYGKLLLDHGVAKFTDWVIEMHKVFGEDITPHLNTVWANIKSADDISTPTTFLHSEVGRLAGELGIDVTKEPLPWVEAIKQARADGISDPRNAVAIAIRSLEKKSEPLTPVEKMGLLDALHTINKERDAIISKRAAGMATAADLARYDALTEEGKYIYEAGYKAASKAGHILGSQRAWLTGPLDDISLTVKWESKIPRPLKESEKETIKGIAKKFKDQQAKVVEAESVAAKKAAESEVQKVAKTGQVKVKGNFERTVTREQVQDALKKLGSVVQPGPLGSGLGSFNLRWTEEETKAVKVLIKYVYESGAVSVEHIAAKVRELLPGKDISDLDMNKMIRDAMGEHGRVVNRGKEFGPDVLTAPGKGGDWALQDPSVRAARNKLQAIRNEADRALKKAIADNEWETATGLKKAGLWVNDILKSSRTAMTTLDDSALGRQSWLIALSDPKSWLKGVSKHMKGITPEGFDMLMDEIRAGAHYEQFQNAGLELRHVTGDEMFQGRLIEKFKPVKKTVDTFERIFDAQTDIASSSAAESMARFMETMGGKPITDDEAKIIATFINDLTGKSKLPGKADRIESLFFAPKLMWSRFRVLNAPGQIIKAFRVSPRAGAAVLYRYVQGGAAMSALLLAAAAGGWEIGRNDEWGKIKKGKLIVDLTAGLGQTAQFMHRAYEAAVGRPRVISGEKQDPLKETLWFLRKKLAPIPGVAANMMDYSDRERRKGKASMLEGRNVTGANVDLGHELLKTAVPIGVQNQVMTKYDSVDDRFWAGLWETMGYGTGYYQPNESNNWVKGTDKVFEIPRRSRL